MFCGLKIYHNALLLALCSKSPFSVPEEFMALINSVDRFGDRFMVGRGKEMSETRFSVELHAQRHTVCR